LRLAFGLRTEVGGSGFKKLLPYTAQNGENGPPLVQKVRAGRGGNFSVEVLELMLPPAGRRIVVWAANVLTLAFSLTLLWAGIQFIDRTWMQQSPVLDVPKWTVYLAIPVGAALESLLMILTWSHDIPAAGEPTDRAL